MHQSNVRRRSLLVSLALLVAASAGAQDLITDRPDFTESSAVVGAGNIQVESGFSYEGDGAGRDHINTLTVPASLTRIGLSRRVELRLGTDGFASSRQGGVRAGGMSDLEIGLKVSLLDEQRAGVDVAIIPMTSLPTGAADATSGAAVPTIKFTWARSLPAGFGLSGNYNLSAEREAGDRFTQQALSVSLGHDLPAGFGGYLEAYGFTPMTPDSGEGWTIDGGISRAFRGNVQFDVEVGRGVTAAAPDWFVGFGVAVRGKLRGRR